MAGLCVLAACIYVLVLGRKVLARNLLNNLRSESPPKKNRKNQEWELPPTSVIPLQQLPDDQMLAQNKFVEQTQCFQAPPYTQYRLVGKTSLKTLGCS